MGFEHVLICTDDANAILLAMTQGKSGPIFKAVDFPLTSSWTTCVSGATGMPEQVASPQMISALLCADNPQRYMGACHMRFHRGRESGNGAASGRFAVG